MIGLPVLEPAATSELQPGDHLLINGRHTRTVRDITDSGYLNYRNRVIWTVHYTEGHTAEWSNGNTAIAETTWTRIT